MTMENDAELLKKYNLLYLEIIMRYRGYIEENEDLSVAELPNLVTPEEESVVGFADNLKSTIQNYALEQNFREAAEKAYKYVKSTITQVELPVDFWLSPDQVIKSGAGDVFDKAVLLCSLLIALGCVSTRIIVVTRQDDRRFVVYSEYGKGLLAFDLDNGISEFQSKDELLADLKIKDGGEVTAYEFNDKMYNNLA